MKGKKEEKNVCPRREKEGESKVVKTGFSEKILNKGWLRSSF